MLAAIDTTAMPANRAGAGVYTYHLTRALVTRLAPGERLAIFDRWRAFDELPAGQGVQVRRVWLPGRGRRIIWEQTELMRSLRRMRVDVFHSPHHSMPLAPTGARTVVTVHDVSFRLLPWRYTLARRTYMNLITTLSARRADAIIVPTRSVARDFVRIFGGDPGRVSVVPEAPPPGMRPIEDERARASARARLALPERFVLSVGTLEPGKNRVNLLRAFAEVKRRGLPHELVVVGQRGWRQDGLVQLASRLGVRDHVRFAGYVPDEDLPFIYNLADALVFPSWREGFGLPPLEALACGTPVVSSDRPAMPEVLGGAALYAPPDNPTAMADALERALSDDRVRDDLRHRGLVRASAYSWDRAARETLGVYRRLAGA